MPPTAQRPKLLVLLLGYRNSKLWFSMAINHLVHFGLITTETDSLEGFGRHHYPFWMSLSPNISILTQRDSGSPHSVESSEIEYYMWSNIDLYTLKACQKTIYSSVNTTWLVPYLANIANHVLQIIKHNLIYMIGATLCWWNSLVITSFYPHGWPPELMKLHTLSQGQRSYA